MFNNQDCRFFLIVRDPGLEADSDASAIVLCDYRLQSLGRLS